MEMNLNGNGSPTDQRVPDTVPVYLFWIYCCLHIIVTVRKAPFRSISYFVHFSYFLWKLINVSGIHSMLIPTLIFPKLLDGLRSFSDIFLHIIVTVCKAPFRSINYFCAFSVFWWDFEMFTGIHAKLIPSHAFTKLLDGLRSFSDIYSCLHIIVAVCKAPFCSIGYFFRVWART